MMAGRGAEKQAFLFVGLLLGAPEFLGASMSVMADPIKIPFCLLSYVALEKGLCSRRPWIFGLAGMVFGMAVVIKFTAVLYLPALMAVLLLARRNRDKQSWAKSVLLFVAGGALWIPYLLQFLVPHSEQLLGAHIVDDLSTHSVLPGEFQFGWQHLFVGTPLWVGGLFALCLLLRGELRFRRLAFPVGVLAVHLLVAAFHTPWWDYYLLDFWPCLAWLSAEACVWTFSWIGERRNRVGNRGATGLLSSWRLALAVLFVSALSASSVIGIGKELTRLHRKPRINEVAVISRLKANASGDKEYLFTNKPIVAFHSGWCLPPQLVVLSLKRFWSGAINHDRMVEELRRCEVSHVYFGGEIREVNPSILKYAEEALGNSEQVGTGVLFSQRGWSR